MVLLVILILVMISIFIYFYALRKVVHNGLMVNKVSHVILLLLIGLIPIVNLIFILTVFIDYYVWKLNLTANDILKAVLFIDVEKDRKDI